MLDHQSGDGAPPRNIHHWGPSHSTSSDDQSQPGKGGGFTNSFNFAKASKLIRPTAQRSSSSDKTDPTAPITTSTKTAGSQQQLSLKTGMQSSPSQTTTTPTNTTPAHSQRNTTTQPQLLRQPWGEVGRVWRLPTFGTLPSLQIRVLMDMHGRIAPLPDAAILPTATASVDLLIVILACCSREQCYGGDGRY